MSSRYIVKLVACLFALKKKEVLRLVQQRFAQCYQTEVNFPQDITPGRTVHAEQG